MYDFPTYLPEKLSQFLKRVAHVATPYYPKNTLQITNAILPRRRQPAAEAEDGVDAGTGKEEDDQGLHDGMGDPAALPTRFLSPCFRELRSMKTGRMDMMMPPKVPALKMALTKPTRPL